MYVFWVNALKVNALAASQSIALFPERDTQMHIYEWLNVFHQLHKIISTLIPQPDQKLSHMFVFVVYSV